MEKVPHKGHFFFRKEELIHRISLFFYYLCKMKQKIIGTVVLVCLHFAAAGQTFPYQDHKLPIEERVEDLIGRLTLEEKLSLLMHNNGEIDRIGLPAYSWWNEALHGVGRNGLASVYPMPIGLAATFDPEFVELVFCNVAREAVEKYREDQTLEKYGDYSGLTFFTPNINIVRDPRWGRGMETYGEDPFLSAMMGNACVNGLQHGNGNMEQLTAAACLKHFAAHSGPEGVRHEFDAEAEARDLFGTYLPAFEYIIHNSDVQQVMCAYNRLNGAPCCTNNWLLDDILRKEWGYEGIVVTDCWALNDCWEQDTVTPRHRTHTTAALAAAEAFGGAVDLECGSGLTALSTAVDSGYIAEEAIDIHLRRVMSTRLRVTDPNDPITAAPVTPYDAAIRSMVLLKNNGILPLDPNKTRIYLSGPNSSDTLMPLGNYNGTPLHTISIEEGLASVFNIADSPTEADVIVYAGGLSPQLEGEELKVEKEGFYKGDRTIIELPKEQRAELLQLKQHKKPIVMLLCTGSAIGLEKEIEMLDGVMVCWYGGETMGKAVADALCGKANNFGRLPVTFYKSTAQLPDFGDYSMAERTYRHMKDEPLYPFGYGLSYTEYSLRSLSYDSASHIVSGVIENKGNQRCNITAPAIIQVYLTHFDSSGYEQKRLIGTTRISTDKESAFSIQIDPFWMRRFDTKSQRMKPLSNTSEYKIAVGLNSNDIVIIDNIR